jgi:hypothetical protein
MLGAKNQHIEDGKFSNKNGQYNSFSVATKIFLTETAGEIPTYFFCISIE